MKILVASLNAHAAACMADVLEREGSHAVTMACDAETLRARLAPGSVHDCYVLDARLVGHDAGSWAELGRARRRGAHVIELALPGDDARFPSRRGAHETLDSPVPPQQLLARIRAAARAGAPSPLLLNALRGAAAEGSGELVIRHAHGNAHVYFWSGRIAWVHRADQPASLRALLPTEARVDDAMALSALERGLARRSTLSEVLLACTPLDGPLPRESVRRWLARALAQLLQLESPTASFVPRDFAYADDLAFPLDSLLGDGAPPETVRPSAAAPRMDRSESTTWEAAFYAAEPPAPHHPLLAIGSQLPGALGLALLNRSTGQCLGDWGLELDAGVAWSLLRAANALASSEAAVELTASTAQRHHLARTLAEQPELLVYVIADAGRTRLAAAQLELRRLLACCGARA